MMSETTFFEQLQRATRPEREALQRLPAIQAALQGTATREMYVGFLAEAYHHVKHTVPLLMACGARLPGRLEWLRTALGRYIVEESGHQEWILADIAACGAEAEAVRNGRPGRATELMVAYAWDMVHRVNPLGFLGMVHVLEGTSTALAHQAAGALRTGLGLPREAFTYLDTHGGLDLEHVAFFESLVNRLTEAEDQAIVIHAARRFYHLYGEIFRGLEARMDLAA